MDKQVQRRDIVLAKVEEAADNIIGNVMESMIDMTEEDVIKMSINITVTKHNDSYDVDGQATFQDVKKASIKLDTTTIDNQNVPDLFE